MNIIVTRQGDLVKIKPQAKRATFKHQYDRGDRKPITEFTSRSRKNLLERLAIIDKAKAKTATFLTLTYASNMQDDRVAYNHLRAFLRRIEREAERSLEKESVAPVRGKDMFFLWRKEYQERGAIHFHIMVWGARWIMKEWVAYEWSSVIGETVAADCSDGTTEKMPVFTRVEFCQNTRKTWYYVSKYLAKDDKKETKSVTANFSVERAHAIPVSNQIDIKKQHVFGIARQHCKPVGEEIDRLAGENKVGLTSAQIRTCVSDKPYSDVLGVPDLSHSERSEDNPLTGRFWGWERRENIPYAQEIVATFDCSREEYIRFRRDMGQLMEWVRDVHLAHTLKMFWFEDVIEPITMFIQSLNGQKVFGWERRIEY